MDHFAPIEVAALQAHDEHFRGGQVGADGDVVLVAVAQGLDDALILPGIAVVGIGEQPPFLWDRNRLIGSPVASATSLPVVAVANRLCFARMLL